MNVRTRATVVIRQPDPDADPGTDGLYREWVHKAQLEQDEFGVTLHWDSENVHSFVPWSSVVRLDFEPCWCTECQRVAKAAA